ncbi:uncharacterized protein [Magallana gigas]|uniref:uncharacterized protein isoform X2 n=1 Tax=Magallana gigas TaxID=29159 RepID=UPI003340D560
MPPRKRKSERMLRLKDRERKQLKRMVFKKGGRASSNVRSTAVTALVMECWEENLSPVQIQSFKQKVLECQIAQEKVKEAHRLAELGLAIVTVMDDPRKPIPPPTLQQLQAKTGSTYGNAPNSQPTKEPPRSTSPDIIFIGESPPTPRVPPSPTITPPTPTQKLQYRFTSTNHTAAVPRQLVKTLHMPDGQVHRFPAYPTLARHPNTTTVRIQAGDVRFTTSLLPAIQNVNPSVTPVHGTYGLGVKRPLPQQPQQQVEDTSPKRKRVETENEVNWVPLDEYYYGKSEGDLSYAEEKNEFRFKCWYCNKMLYNNIKAMMHIQGHIDSSKQQNIDLSDLTQCKHCYRQFDTPFEMQTHVEKVHMNNVNVLMCRICERDHQSRHALLTHMRVNHNACEMPYICQLCKFRSSMYSDVVDHFKKKHDSSQHILCLYCLKVFVVKFVSQGWGQTQTYYGHLLKHQSKSGSKKCNSCRLTFVNPADCKNHKKKDHVANQKGIGSCSGAFEQDLMIKMPEARKQAVKSLNAPAVSKVLDFGGTRFPYAVNFNTCVECKTVMGTPDHFRKHIECSMCRFATSCSIAYANHMMGFHSGQMTSLNLNIPWERPMKEHMHCLCGFASRYGNKIANHLVYCTKRSCYNKKPTQVIREVEEEEQDPRHKPGASLLDVLGLVKKKNITTKIQKRRSSEEPSELVWKSSGSTPQPAEQEERQENDGIPSELKGATKWKTVKIKDPSTPSKASVFLGASDESSKDLESTKDPKEKGDAEISIKKEKIDSIEDQYSAQPAEDSSEEKPEETSGHEEDSLKVTIETDIQSDEEKDMEDTLLSAKEMMEEKSENSLLGIKSERMDDDNMIEDTPPESGVIKQDDAISDSALDTSGVLEEEITEKENEAKEKNEVMFDSALNTSDNVEEDMTEREEKEEGESALVKETVSESAEDHASNETKENSSLLTLAENQTGSEEKEEEGEQSEKILEESVEDKQINQKVEESTEDKKDNQKDVSEENSEELDVPMEADDIVCKKDESASGNQVEGENEDQGKEEEKKAEVEETAEVGDNNEKSLTEPVQVEDGGRKFEKIEQDQSNKKEKQEEIEKDSSESVSTEKREDQGVSANAESVSLVEEGTKGPPKADDTEVAKKESSRDKPTEDTESRQRSEASSRRSPTQSRRPDDSHHHHDNRSSGRSDHRGPNRFGGPPDNRGWSRHDHHPHDNRDNYRHHGQSRHYEDRHQFDRNRYDDRRHGYHGNRHDEHDHRYGYDNRATRGFLRGQGYYRGGYRDYR